MKQACLVVCLSQFLLSQDRVAAELYAPAAGSLQNDGSSAAAAFLEVGSFAGRGFDITALRMKASLRQSLLESLRISEQGITLDMPSTSKHSAISMFAAQAAKLHSTDVRAFQDFLDKAVHVISQRLLPTILQRGASIQRDGAGLTVAVQDDSDDLQEHVWASLQHTANAVLDLHHFLVDILAGAPQGEAAAAMVHAALAQLWNTPHSADRPSVGRWLQRILAQLPVDAFSDDKSVAAVLRHLAQVQQQFLAGESSPPRLTCLPSAGQLSSPAAITAGAATYSLYIQVRDVYTPSASSQPTGSGNVGQLPSLPEATAAAGAAGRDRSDHEVKRQQALAAKGGSPAQGSWLEPIDGPSMFSQPTSARSASADTVGRALQSICTLLQARVQDEEAAVLLCECLLRLPLVAKAGCLSAAAGGDASACFAAVCDLQHIAFAATQSVGSATHLWDEVPGACAVVLARAVGVLDELRSSMRAQLQQGTLLLARQLRSAVAETSEDDSPTRALRRALALLSDADDEMCTLLLDTNRRAVLAHLLGCTLTCLWDSIGQAFHQLTPALQREVQALVEEWCAQHAPGVPFADLEHYTL